MANQYTTSFPQRFWDKVEKTENCWEWTARKNKYGYGEFLYSGRVWKSHRLSYLLEYGDYDFSLIVLHTCDNPSCVNPNHLMLGTQKENVQDMVLKNRHGKGQIKLITYDEWLSIRPKKNKDNVCKRGHKFSDKNTRIKLVGSRYIRVCRACQFMSQSKDIVSYKVKSFVRKVPNRAEIIKGIIDKVYAIGVKCYYCNGNFECLDHIIPKKYGGEISIENINPSCNHCNQKRKNQI
jgi:5-methylcytosine-specific restriction endonuclease McrA